MRLTTERVPLRTTEKIQVFVDLDECLGYYLQALLEWIRKNWDTAMPMFGVEVESYDPNDITEDDFSSYRLDAHPAFAHLDQTRTKILLAAFHYSEEFSSMGPIPDAISLFLELAKKNQYILTVLTSRQNQIIDQTILWLGQHFPGVFSGPILCNNMSLDKEMEYDKSEFVKSFRARVMIDDSTSHLVKASPYLIVGFLIDKPWNKDVLLPPNIVRVYNYAEIQEYLSLLFEHSPATSPSSRLRLQLAVQESIRAWQDLIDTKP